LEEKDVALSPDSDEDIDCFCFRVDGPLPPDIVVVLLVLFVDGMRGLESASSNADAWDDFEPKAMLDICSFQVLTVYSKCCILVVVMSRVMYRKTVS